jgi:hypothetical protein
MNSHVAQKATWLFIGSRPWYAFVVDDLFQVILTTPLEILANDVETSEQAKAWVPCPKRTGQRLPIHRGGFDPVLRRQVR